MTKNLYVCTICGSSITVTVNPARPEGKPECYCGGAVEFVGELYPCEGWLKNNAEGVDTTGEQ